MEQELPHSVRSRSIVQGWVKEQGNSSMTAAAPDGRQDAMEQGLSPSSGSSSSASLVKDRNNGNDDEDPKSPLCAHDTKHPRLVSSSPRDMNIQVSYAATKPPKKTLQAVYATGRYKAALTNDVLATQSFMAGVYIAAAGQLFLSVGGGFLGASLFPFGLIAVILTSAELFTGDALVFVASLLGGQVRVRSLLRNWTVSWCFNFVGCIAWAGFLGYLSGALEDLGQADYAVSVALKKANQPWMSTFLKGIGANFMVCVGVWQATCAEEVSGKVLALWFPITGFVTMGLDHCIANQFFIPLGMMMGADISVFDLFFRALLPATLGNVVGGGLFVGAIYWYVFDSMETLNSLRSKIWRGLSNRRSSERAIN